MGLGAEMMAESLEDEMLDFHLAKNRKVWQTKDGRKIKIEDMETSHIENTINYLSRNDKVVPELMYTVLMIRKQLEKVKSE